MPPKKRVFVIEECARRWKWLLLCNHFTTQATGQFYHSHISSGLLFNSPYRAAHRHVVHT